MTRRADNELRSAINTLEEMHQTTTNSGVILSRSLKQLMKLLQSDYGFAYDCSTPEQGFIPWHLVALFSNAEQRFEELPLESNSRQIPAEWLPAFLSGRLINIAETNTKVPVFFPTQHPDINNIIY